MLGRFLSRTQVRIPIAQLLLYIEWNGTIRWNFRRRDLFLSGIFSILGRLARAEGVPSSDSSKVIDDFARFLLAPSTKLQVSALRSVRQKGEVWQDEHSDNSKGEDAELLHYLDSLSLLIRPSLAREALLDVMIAVALASGCLNPTQENVLRMATARWGISGSRYLAILSYREGLVDEQQRLEDERLEEIWRRSEEATNSLTTDSPIEWAYEELELRSSALFTEVKRSYRRLAMQYHPDKYARGSEAQGEANDRFKRIQKAYEAISESVK